jgi:hypothetical protein
MSECPAIIPIRWTAVSCVLAAACLLPMAAAHAVVRCIESGLTVQSTLDAALASANAVEDVRIKSGNYLLTSGEIGYFGVLQGNGKTMRISGGWAGPVGQCTAQTGGQASTVFWGMGARPVFGINASTTFVGKLTIENMLFGGGYSGGSTPSCLTIGEQNGGLLDLVVDRIHVEGCVSTTHIDASVVELSASTGVVLRNSLIASNDAGVSLPVSVSVKGGPGWVLNNTIADNTTANTNHFVGLAASASNGGTLTVANNLFSGNVGSGAVRYEIRLGMGVALLNNRFTGLSGTPASNVGSTSGPAGFMPGGFDLSPMSPARDAGANFAAAVQGELDVAGRRRVRGSAVDLGAYEYHGTFFTSGFESP